MTGAGMRIGLAVPVFAAPGIIGLRTPSVERLEAADVRRALRLAEDLGFDSAWFSDHLFHGRDGAFLECWTTLAAAIGATERIRLVTNHLGVRLRSAPLIAKMAATADALSDGRVELFLSHGLREREHVSYGYGWEPDVERRLDLLSESVDVIRALWTGEPVDHDGPAYRLRDARSIPAPSARIPIWLGGPLDDATAALIAREADGWNALPSSPDDYADQAARVDAACRAIGRDPATLRRSLETQVLVLGADRDARDWDDWLAHWRRLRERAPLGAATSDLLDPRTPFDEGAAADTAGETFVIGTEDEVAERLATYRGLGVDEVACWLMDWPDEGTLRALATRIRPRVAAGAS